MTDPGNPSPYSGQVPGNQAPGASPYPSSAPEMQPPSYPGMQPPAQPGMQAPAPPPGGWAENAPGSPASIPWGNQAPAGPYYQVPSAPPPLGERPQSIKIAAYLMIAGGIINVLSLVLAFTVVDLRKLIDERFAQQAAQAGTEIPPEVADMAYSIVVGSTVFSGIVGLFLWLWMAWKNWQGRGWARVVATVFLAIGALSFAQSVSQQGAPILLVMNVLSMAAGLISVVLLWRGTSTDYYEAVRAQRIARVPGSM